MLPVNLIITSAGLDALVDAEAGDTDPIEITQVGLSNVAVEAAPTLVALPGEFKRIDAISGQSVAANIIHMTAQDPSADIYDLRSVALYLADGTLFAAYGQADPIFTKVSIATFLLAFDVAFSGDIADAVVFGDASFLYPPATETEKGVAEIATQAEVDAEADDSRIVTPLKLGVRLAGLLGALDDALAAETAARIAGDNALQAAIDALADLLVKPGSVHAFAMNAAPAGYLECNGAAVSRAAYAALFAAIGTTHGVGDGATTFNLPDLRGEFVRGWDHGRGVDLARAFGSTQADEFKSHTHGIPADGVGATPSLDLNTGGSTNRTTLAAGGTETRPRNVALLYAIKT